MRLFRFIIAIKFTRASGFILCSKVKEKKLEQRFSHFYQSKSSYQHHVNYLINSLKHEFDVQITFLIEKYIVISYQINILLI